MMADMSPAGSSAPGEPALPAQLRASHEDRDQVIEALRVAAGDGRLTVDELGERIESAFGAKTYGELAALVRDLPASGTPGIMPEVRPGSTAAAAKDLIKIECQSGNAVRNGRWVVPRRMQVRVSSGQVTLDLTEAVIAHRALDIEAEVRSGHLKVLTRPGIVVDTDDVVIRSGNVKVKAPWGTEVPTTLVVTVSGKVGSGLISARPPRRSFWQWLLRRPLPYATTPAITSR
jgi:hypothetical protein